MSAHQKAVENHTIFSHITKTKSTISEVLSSVDLSSDDKDIILRLNLIAENFEQSILSCDYNLISTSWLTEAQGSMSQVNTNLTSYMKMPKSQPAQNKKNHLNNAVTNMEKVLNTTAKINMIKSEQSLHVHIKALENHTTLINSIISDYSKELDAAKSIVSQLPSLEDKITQHINEKDTEIIKSLGNAQNVLDNHIQDFNAKIRDIHTQHNAVLKDYGDDFSNIEKNIETRVETLSERIIGMQNAYKISFDKLLQKGEEILEIVTRDSFSHNYGKAASDARKSVRLWNGLAIIAMLLVVGFTVYAFIIALNQDINWTNVVSKTLVTTAGASISIYAARQAAKHEQVERYSRKIELELAAFDPFISTLEKDDQDSMKKEITKRIFGNSNYTDEDFDKRLTDTLGKTIKMDELIKLISTLRGIA